MYGRITQLWPSSFPQLALQDFLVDLRLRFSVINRHPISAVTATQAAFRERCVGVAEVLAQKCGGKPF